MRDILLTTFAAVCVHLTRAPLFSLERLQDYVLCVLNAALMDSTNYDNLFWHEERVIEIGPLMAYTPLSLEQVTTSMRDLQGFLQMDEVEKVTLETGVRGAGYLFGPGEIWVTARLVFKKEKRNGRPTDQLPELPVPLPSLVAPEVPTEPGLLAQSEPHTPGSQEEEVARGGDSAAGGADQGPGTPSS